MKQSEMLVFKIHTCINFTNNFMKCCRDVVCIKEAKLLHQSTLNLNYCLNYIICTLQHNKVVLI